MATATQCAHLHSTVIGERGYNGSVATHADHENRAAHGWLTFRVQCSACGARRSENHNGAHVEYGPWGAPRAARKARADIAAREAAALLAAVPPLRLSLPGGRAVDVSLDRDGLIDVGTDEQLQREVTAALLAEGEWIELAQRARAAVTQARELRRAV